MSGFSSEDAGARRPHALVTGGARRVGRAIALELARSGCDVTITFARSEVEARAAVVEIEKLGARGAAIELALEDPSGIDEVAKRLAEDFPRLDVLVHNASSYTPSPLERLDPERLVHDYVVNAAAPLLLSARLAGLLAESNLLGGGAIVSMADIHSMGRPRKDFASYSMAKAALIEMTRCLARDLAPRVRVNAVAPGVVAWPESGPESERAAQEAYLRRVPLGRAGTLEEAAKVVRWLALEASYITGEVVRLDGGRWLA